MKLLANSKKQDLSRHLKAIAYFCRAIYDTLGFEKTESYNNMRVACYTAGLFHDIGKIDPEYQNWIRNITSNESPNHPDDKATEKTWERFVRHNEISWLLLKAISITSNTNGIPCLVKGINGITDTISYSVYWHHEEKSRNVKIINGKYFENLLESRWKEIKEIFEVFSNDLKKGCEYENISFSLNNDVSVYDPIPAFKTLDTLQDMDNSLVRACLIEADRIVSGLSKNDLDNLFDSEERINCEKFNLIFGQFDSIVKNFSLSENIQNRISLLEDPITNKDFDAARNKKQKQTANSLAEKMRNKNYCILQGPAGVGKTNISLMLANELNVKKVVYICPRVQVCQQNYISISKELPGIKTQIFTGEYKYTSLNEVENTIEENDFLNAEIVVTTIDQISSLFLNHLKATKLLSLLRKDTLLIFDEFHELKSLPGHYPSFKEIINLKRKISNYSIGVLFMSATPNPIFIADALSLNKNNEVRYSTIKESIVKIPSFNEKPIHFEFTENNKNISRSVKPGEIFIYNIIKDLQNDYLQNSEMDTCIAYHSGFAPNHKKIVFNDIIAEFGKEAALKQKKLGLRAGPVVQASLDISTSNLTTQETCAEDLLQRFGRCNRWGYDENSNITVIKHGRTPNNKLFDESQNRYLKENFCLNTTLAFGKFIESKKGNVFDSNINELYELYFIFVEDNKKAYELDLKDFKDEVKRFYEMNDFFKPIQLFSKKTKKQSLKLAKVGLRGASVYALPVKITWNKNKEKLEYKKNNNNEFCWLWNPAETAKNLEQENEIDTGELLTVSRDVHYLLGAGTLLSLFQASIIKKSCNARILYKEDTFTKYNTKKAIHVLNRAQSPEAPILISDPEDIFGLGYGTKNIDSKDEDDDDIKQNFGYHFEFDKNQQRHRGIGLVDINKISQFFESKKIKESFRNE